MANTAFVWVVRGRHGKLQIFCSRNVPHDLTRLREKGRADLVHIEAFPTSREAFNELNGLKRLSKKQLKGFLTAIHQGLHDLFPSLVGPGGLPMGIDTNEFYSKLGLKNPDDDDLDTGFGGVPAYNPWGPRTLSGSAACPIPREEKWVDHVGLRYVAQAAQDA